MVVWFVVIARARRARRSPQRPGDPEGALADATRVELLRRPPAIAFFALGAVVLAVTGAEALYADMGHFGRAPISRAWFFLVFPALILNYLGQGSLILDDPGAIENPFFLLCPTGPGCRWSSSPPSRR